MVRFGQRLGLRVVAEGVEDAQSLAYLQELDCDLAQGYHIAKPLEVGDVEDWLSRTADTRTSLRPASAPRAAARQPALELAS